MADAPLRRLLIVTYYWPPSGGSGVQRWLKLAKYLPSLGWQPVIVAPEDADYELRDESLEADVPAEAEVLRLPIREPYAAYRALTGARPSEPVGGRSDGQPGLLKRLSLWVRANLFIPDPKVLWVRPTSRRLRDYLRDYPVDAVLTTGPPHSVHLIGERLARQTPGLPWLLDVRDPWSKFDVHLGFGMGTRAIAKNRAHEARCLAEATRVLCTAPSMPDNLEPFDPAKVRVLTNGFDEDDFANEPAPRPPGQGFVLLHAGMLGANRNPRALWRALAARCRRSAGFADRLRIRLVGTVADEVVASIRGHAELRDRLELTPWLAHDELLRLYGEADCLLLCPTRSANARSQINGKLFEYLAARRPVLHVGPYDADNTRLLDEAHAGLTVPPGDVDGAAYALEQIDGGRFAAGQHAFNAEVIARYSRRATAERLVQILAEVVR